MIRGEILIELENSW